MLLRAGNDTIFPGDSMAKNRYTIGEVAEMMGVSVQTIRYYCKIGLIRPAYTNGETGYRYFAPEQLHPLFHSSCLMERMAFFSNRLTCACEMPISEDTSIWVLP